MKNMTGSLKQSYNMTKLRNIKLKHTILVSFLLLSIFFSVKNIATNHNRNGEPIYVITDSRLNIANINSWFGARYHIVLETDTDTLREIRGMLYFYDILGLWRNIYVLLFIADRIYTSLYNYFTGHNKRKQGWYHGKFFVYFGKKINITKNFHLDLYFSLLKFCANLLEHLAFLFFVTEDLLLLILKTISLDININIGKIFYFCFNLMSLIRICILHNRRSLRHSETIKYLSTLFEINLPQNFNLSNIHCWKPQEHTHFNTNNIIQNA